MDTLTNTWFLIFVGLAVVVTICALEWLSSRRRKHVPLPSGVTTNDYQVFSAGGFSLPAYPLEARLLDSLPSFSVPRGGIIFGGPLTLVIDWDWPEAPSVSAPDAPAAMPDHWPAWRMANWTREEWDEFARASGVAP